MFRLDDVKKHLRPGRVYRRAEFTRWSRSVDRHLQQLQEEGYLTKLAGGLYYCPRKTTFGTAPADDKTLVKAFLKDGRFLITSPNAYNTLGVGTTQLYNTTVVYNRKRHGRFDLGGRVFDFRVKPYFPSHLTPEFLLVDLVNNLKELAEDHDRVLGEVRKKAASMDARVLSKTVKQYGSTNTRKFFAEAPADGRSTHAIL
ncbi:MAG: hypothetical protein ACP5SH_27050 [Syntrophobacteraceae bacterium]